MARRKPEETATLPPLGTPKRELRLKTPVNATTIPLGSLREWLRGAGDLPDSARVAFRLGTSDQYAFIPDRVKEIVVTEVLQ